MHTKRSVHVVESGVSSFFLDRMLLKEGVARSEMARVENEIKVINEHRRRNARKGLWERIQEVFRSIENGLQIIHCVVT
jgi:hypothetical protein